jgi:hypothetical protein
MEPVPMQPIRGRSLAESLAKVFEVQAKAGTKPPATAAAPKPDEPRN